MTADLHAASGLEVLLVAGILEPDEVSPKPCATIKFREVDRVGVPQATFTLFCDRPAFLRHLSVTAGVLADRLEREAKAVKDQKAAEHAADPVAARVSAILDPKAGG